MANCQVLISKPTLFAKRIPSRNPIVQEIGHHHSGAHDRGQLPRERIRLLALLNRTDHLIRRVINLQEEWQLRLTAGRQWSLDKSRMNDSYIDSLRLQIEPQTFEQGRDRSFAGTIGGGFWQATIRCQARNDRELTAASLGHLRNYS